jgi:hypothetical protein
MFPRHRLGRTDELGCPHAMGTDVASELRSGLGLVKDPVLHKLSAMGKVISSHSAATHLFTTDGRGGQHNVVKLRRLAGV